MENNIPAYFLLGFNKGVFTYDEYRNLFSEEEQQVCSLYWNRINNSISPNRIIYELWNNDTSNPQFKEMTSDYLLSLKPACNGIGEYGRKIIDINVLYDFFQSKTGDMELDIREINDYYIPCLLDILYNVIADKKLDDHEETNSEFYLDQLYHNRTNLNGLYEIKFKRTLQETIVDILYNRNNEYTQSLPVWLSEWLVGIENVWFDKDDFLTRYTL